MISRVADHCFWFGRYVERAEASARMLTASHNLALDAELEPAQSWRPVIVVSGEEAQFRERFVEKAPPAGMTQAMAGMTQSMTGMSMTQAMAGMTQAMTGMTQATAPSIPDLAAAPDAVDRPDDHPAWGDGELVERFMTWDEDNVVSIKRSVLGARWNARQIREVLSLEAWETVNELHLWMASETAATEWRDHRWSFYRHVRQMTQLCLGQLRSTMLHDEPLDFVWIGVLLERVSQTARILDVHHHAIMRAGRHVVVETALWLSLLRALGGYEPFMKRFQGHVSPEAVARFLIGEVRFPRSIAFCIHSAYDRLCAIRPPEARDLPGGATLERMRVLDGWTRSRTGEPVTGDSVHELLTHVVDEVHDICDSLARELLGHGA